VRALLLALLFLPLILGARGCSWTKNPANDECYQIRYEDMKAYRMLSAEEVRKLEDLGWKVQERPDRKCRPDEDDDD
jgi:hypothetical protein